MQAKYNIIVSQTATQLLVSHVAFLAQVSEIAAEKLVADFETATQALEIMPQRCAWLSGEFIPKNKYRALIFDKRYLLIFQIKEETIYIDYVVDCRQDYTWLIT